ncbi:MAG: peptidylprolyl isomerase [Chlorobiaceae bacterium]|nr:peptidylprolyl isomerase [Chlorobiaceae bacterium]NTW75198.1 peptidylprolyl isomerase [Chlorobiaceae bacterium]
MAIMSKLRDKTHIILFILVGAFLALIIFEWGMNFSGPTRKGGLVGKVNGQSITTAQYDEIYNGLRQNFMRSNPGADVNSQVEMNFREQAWNIVVDQALVEEMFKKYGITVQDREVLDAVNSVINPPMIIRQNFTDPRTGQIDRAVLEKARRDPQAKAFWVKAEEVIKRELMVDKLLLALKTMGLVTDPEVSELVQRQYTQFSASFIPVPLSYAGTDAQFPVKEDEVKKWYEAHKEQLKQDPNRKADFVIYPMVPSSQDSLQVKKEIDALLPQFASAPSDSEFVKVQSDRPNSVNVTLSRADFSPAAASAVFGSPKLAPGQIVGPVADRGMYRLLKIKSVSAGQPVASASHILIRFNQADPADTQRALMRAAMLFDQLKKGARFEELATRYSEDPGSARFGGSVGWFSRQRMVPQFAEAVFASKPGQVIGPVRTQFGLHIIKVDGFDNRQIVCSEVSRQIKPSTQTSESIKHKAVAFQSDAKSKGFAESARQQHLEIGKTGEFTKTSMIPVIGQNEQIVRFAFKAKEGDISDVIETELGFVVMKLTSKNDTGYRQLDADLQKKITAELVAEKKAAALKARLASMAKSPGATLESIVAKDPSLKLVTSPEIRWRDGFIAGYGQDRQLVEAMAGMTPNRLSQPVQCAGGYALVKLTGRTQQAGLDPAAEKARILPQLMKVKQEQLFSEYFNTVRRTAKIEDFRQQ